MAVIEQTVILGSLESDILQNNMGGVKYHCICLILCILVEIIVPSAILQVKPCHCLSWLVLSASSI